MTKSTGPYVIIIDDMTLKWYRKGNSIFAIGKRARYTIVDRRLTAVGFDGLPLLSVRPYGAVFSHEFKAMHAAEELDSREYLEVQMGGE